MFPIEALHVTTVDYWKSIMKEEVLELFIIEVDPDLKSLFT